MTQESSINGSVSLPGAVDVLIVGAGWSGMYMLHRLRKMGFSTWVVDAASDVGGTWYWNRYPGARCDVPSMEYSFGFDDAIQQEWEWTERYASQPEILRYAQFVADRLDLRRNIKFDTRVVSAEFDDETCRWLVTTDAGDETTTEFLVMATGALSEPRYPDIDGIMNFAGAIYHTSRWPHEPVDVSGRTVGVIGTGSTGIQVIPALAETAAQLYVFQRTPHYAVPAQNTRLDPAAVKDIKSKYAELRAEARHTFSGSLYARGTMSALEVSAEERERVFESRWQAGGTAFLSSFTDLMRDLAANETAAEFVRHKIRQIVRDEAVADALSPSDYPFGAKRLCLETRYYEAFNRDNVTLVDIRKAPITRMTSEAVVTTDAEYPLDVLVLATGFDALTGALERIDIRNGAEALLRDRWRDGPRTYLGVAVSGFPNLFIVAGPGSPSVLSNMFVSVEQHVEWISDCIMHMRCAGLRRIEATPEDEEQWVAHVNEAADRTLFPRANSYYVGANIPGKPRVFMPYVGGVGVYRDLCDKVAHNGYRGFVLT